MHLKRMMTFVMDVEATKVEEVRENQVQNEVKRERRTPQKLLFICLWGELNQPLNN